MEKGAKNIDTKKTGLFQSVLIQMKIACNNKQRNCIKDRGE